VMKEHARAIAMPLGSGTSVDAAEEQFAAHGVATTM